MSLEVSRYQREQVADVKAFNRRLRAAGLESSFPESHKSLAYPQGEGRPIWQEYYLAADPEAVRGGYILRYQDFWLRGELLQVADYQLPLSEGIVDRKFALVGFRLLTNAQEQHPHLFALGMGGLGEPLPRMLSKMRWRLQLVPFFFHLLHPSRFLRKNSFFRRNPWLRVGCDVLAGTGGGWLGARVLQSRGLLRPSDASVAVFEDCARFDEFADALWKCAKHECSFVGVRDAQNLNLLYPAGDERYIRLRVDLDGTSVGWVVVIHTQMTQHKQFGDLHVGTIVDGFAHERHVPLLVHAAVQRLRQANVDLIVSNQLHRAWQQALKRAGFLSGPSNYALAVSKSIARRLEPWDDHVDTIHFNRGDGDGPINL